MKYINNKELVINYLKKIINYEKPNEICRNNSVN
jgi:hypothetical protein